MFFKKTYYDEKGNAISVVLECDKCGKLIEINNKSNVFSEIKNDSCIVINGEKIKCNRCNNNCQNGLIRYKTKKDSGNFEVIHVNNIAQANAQAQEWLNKPKCPTCGSTNIQKISGASKAIGFVAFGLLSKNARSQFKCNNCGYKW